MHRAHVPGYAGLQGLLVSSDGSKTGQAGIGHNCCHDRDGAEPAASTENGVWGRQPGEQCGMSRLGMYSFSWTTLLSKPALPAAPPSREASRPPEEPSAPSPTLPAQFKQRAPMYNSGLSPATPTPAAPTSPLTPTTPPAATPTAQTPPVAMVAPQTQAPAPVQQQPKKNLSLTVGTLAGFMTIRWMA